MRYFTFIFSLIICIAFCSANNGVLSGCIYNDDGFPIDFANVLLIETTDSSRVAGTYTNENGEFAFNVPFGCYRVEYSCMGYRSKCDTICYSKDFLSDTVHLSVETNMLNEIVVKARRPSIKRNATGIIISVDNVKYLQNKTLDKILALSPGVFIDSEGNVSINGNSGVTIIFNDRTIRLSGEQLVSYLKSIQGKDLKEIEIMSNPTAAYDAEGSGGIIKIDTRRSREMGLTGFISADLFYDRKFSLKPTFGLAYSLGRVTLYGNYNYFNYRDVVERYTNDKYNNGKKYLFSEMYHGSGNTHNFTIGIDWEINNNHYLGIEYNGMVKNSIDNGDLTTKSYLNSSYKGKIVGLNESAYNRDNSMFNLNYVWRIDSIGTVLKFTADYTDITGRDDTDDYYNEYYNSFDTNTDVLYKRQISNENAYIYSTKIDFETNWNHGIWKLGTGIKFSSVKNDYSYNLLSWKNEGETPQEDPLFKDKFKYIENIYAGYANIYLNGQKFEANGGVRIEYERAEGISQISGENNIRNEFHLFPSTFLYWKPCRTSGFMVYYGMRIRRPSYLLLNPFVCYLSDISLKKGNPKLKPEIVNSIELTYVLFGKYYMSLRSEFRSDRISDVSYTDGQYTITTTTNLSGYRKFYFNSYIPLGYKLWSGSVMLNAGLLETMAYEKTSRTLDMNISWNNSFHFSDDFVAQMNLYYAPPYKDVYFSSDRHKFKIDVNFDYTFYNNKWLLTLGCDDILDSTRKNFVTGVYPELVQEITTYGISAGRTFYVGLKFNFSTKKKTSHKRKSTSISDELNRL